MPLAAAESDEATFRHGTPVRMAGWLSVKHGRLSRKQPRYAKLYGEVLSFLVSEEALPEEELNVVGAIVEFSDRDSKKTFRVIVGRRTFIIFCGSFEEMQSWAQSLLFASQRCFERYYTQGPILADGTYSRVFYAKDVDDPSKVFAVKIIKKRSHDIQALEWVRRERHVNSMLNHPGIVQAVDMFSTVEKDHLVFELMTGGTLADLLRKHNRLPESYARVVMRELITALHYIHSKNIVHRDVRPENIFCSASKFPMSIALGDFGYANFVSEKRVNHDVLTTMIGVPPYICVDICRRIKYGPLVDMWSAGVVLYEILSGERPFEGRSDRETVENIKIGTIHFTTPIWSKISPAAKGLIKQLMQTDPHKRISALAALQHTWFCEKACLSRPTSVNTLFPSSPASNGVMYGDRDSPSNTSTDSRRHPHISGSISNFSRIPSSSSSQSPVESTTQDSSERQTSLLGLHQPSLRSMHHVSSTSSLGPQPRLKVTPSVRAIAERGLQRVTSDNPARMKRLLNSSVVQKQLSVALPYRRILIVTARAFVAVFRLKALRSGHSATRQLSLMGQADVDDVNALIDRRTAAMKKANEENQDGVVDRASGRPLQGSNHNQRRGHVRHKSRDMASHIMGRLSLDRKAQDSAG
ncbi:Serine/threonine protein kinase [Chondrus crispus]|uniref:Serine/threonine protein kinase n=1 Tax=Chondrus crispus TaxID=2769 RepID=R7QLL6_CHOCR|nr:Serine/threonine protein kinase [Chondrus crispus]CDF39392.1 Serine/threonine protein kinase [Chondrus crispus]|eukprot:XP_005719303.1 Serine/threonine protein kinase [Chondrus crispus]